MPVDFNTLEQKHFTHDVQLFANRHEALKVWKKGAKIAELGVAFGKHTDHIFKVTSPQQYDGYDTFILHTLPEIWGKPLKEWIGEKTHLQFIQDKYSDLIAQNRIRLFPGDSSTELAKRQPDSYDIVYIDGNHRYSGALKDTEAAIKVLKPDGMLVFNDYVCFDRNAVEFGVIPIVNELCRGGQWKMRYLAMEARMFCDVALVRA